MISLKKFKKNFGIKVKEYRLKADLTQAKLAELIELENSGISRIETGETFVSSVVLCKICNALKVTPIELFDFNNIYTKDLTPNEKITAISESLKDLPDNQLDFVYEMISCIRKNFEK